MVAPAEKATVEPGGLNEEQRALVAGLIVERLKTLDALLYDDVPPEDEEVWTNRRKEYVALESALGTLGLSLRIHNQASWDPEDGWQPTEPETWDYRLGPQETVDFAF